MAEKKSFDLRGYFTGLKTILAWNPILILLVRMLSMYGSAMKSGIRSMYVVNDLGLTPTLLGTAVSVFTLCEMIGNVPTGAAADNYRKRIKVFLAFGMICRAVTITLFLVVHDAATMYIVFALDGFAAAITNVLTLAILALSVDRRVMGSSYALMIAIQNFFVAYARPMGLRMYESQGMVQPVLVICGIYIVGAVLALMLRTGDWGEKINTVQIKKESKGIKGILSGISPKVIPLAIVLTLPMILFSAENNYGQLTAESLGFLDDNYLNAVTAGTQLHSVLSLVVGVLVDLINPYIIVTILLLGQAAAPLIASIAPSSGVFSVGIFLAYGTRSYDSALRAMGMKMMSQADQGKFSSTMQVFASLFSLVGALLLGFIADISGSYRTMWMWVFALVAIAFVLYQVCERTIFRKMRAAAAAESETAVSSDK